MAGTNGKLPNAADLIQAVLALSPAVADGKALRVITSGAKVKTLPDVAKAFGMAPQTINGSWRSNGMPGTTGRYDLAEILGWLIERNARLAQRPDALSDEARQADERKRIADANRAEYMEELARLEVESLQGGMIDVREAKSQIRQTLHVLVNGMLGIPRECLPGLPEVCAVETAEFIDKSVRRKLAAARQSLEQIAKEPEDHETAD